MKSPGDCLGSLFLRHLWWLIVGGCVVNVVNIVVMDVVEGASLLAIAW